MILASTASAPVWAANNESELIQHEVPVAARQPTGPRTDDDVELVTDAARGEKSREYERIVEPAADRTSARDDGFHCPSGPMEPAVQTRGAGRTRRGQSAGPVVVRDRSSSRTTQLRPPTSTSRRGADQLQRHPPPVVRRLAEDSPSTAALRASACGPLPRRTRAQHSARAREAPPLVERPAVGAGARHRVEGVRHMDDPSDERDLLSTATVRIAASVRPLVVQLDDGEVRREERDRPRRMRAPSVDAA